LKKKCKNYNNMEKKKKKKKKKKSEDMLLMRHVPAATLYLKQKKGIFIYA